MQLYEIVSLVVLNLLAFTLISSVVPSAMGNGNLTVNWIEIGQNGVLTTKSPTIRLSVTDSSGSFVPGVTITIQNPPYCLETYPYYEWTVTEQSSEYIVRANSFPPYAIRDKFQFTFTKTGYNTLTLQKELKTNAPCIEFVDKTGAYRSESDLQFSMQSIPSCTMVSNKFQVVFVESRKYDVTYTYQS